MTQPPQPPQPPQPGQNPYQPYGQPYGGFTPAAPDHPQSMTILILGILGLALCQALAPVAWFMGSKARKEIAESNGAIGPSQMVTVGWALGIAGSIFLILGLLFLVVYIVFFVVIFGAAVSTGV